MTTPKIGAFVLETLTTGMYTNPLDTLREFIQNSADSIRAAEDKKLIAKGEGLIEVRLDHNARMLTVRDNGIGIPQANVHDRLMNIGMSAKRIETDAGFRGIGRLAGIAYCKALHFHTTSPAETVTSTVEIDCEGLRKAISPAMRQTEELANVVAKNSKIGQERCKSDSHYFEVVMEGLGETVSEVFLNLERTENYLSQVAPIEYDAQHFLFAPLITDWMRKSKMSIPTVTLVIKTSETERQVFKPYKIHYKTRGAKDAYKLSIKDIEFYPQSPSPDSLFWLWYSKSELLGAIDDERAAGLRLRKNNIGIGGAERVAELFADVADSNARFNDYYIGEIHVMSSDAIPNARRDGFEDIGTWPKIRKELTSFARERSTEIRAFSDARNRQTPKVIRAAESVLQEAAEGLDSGFVSAEERDSLLKRVHREEKRATLALNARRATAPQEAEKIVPVVRRLEETREKLERENHFVVKKLRSHLDRKQRRIIKEILNILYEVLDKPEFKKAESAILAKYQISNSETDS